MDKFAFGENWASYSERLEFEDYLSAKKDLDELVPDIKNKTFLDIGCGSGLHSVAAGALGAAKVLGLDVDSKCVETSKKLLEKIAQQDTTIKKDAFEFKVQSILDQDFTTEDTETTEKNRIINHGSTRINTNAHQTQINTDYTDKSKIQNLKSQNVSVTERFDIVYSWGVLHHTGDMYKAFEVVAKLVKDDGVLTIAIYNKYFTSPLWKAVKFTYVKSPTFVKKILIWLGVIRFSLVALLLTGKIPWRGERGMHFYTDVVDWIGGYPYEYASADEVINFFVARGFKLKTFIKAQGGTGCNQFVFDRVK